MQQKQPLTKAFIHKAGPFAKRGKNCATCPVQNVKEMQLVVLS